MIKRPASISRRFLAMSLDWLILIVPWFFGSWVLPVLGGLVLYFLYEPICDSSELQATPGKYALGIQVTDLDGRRISLRAAYIRCLAKLASSCFFCMGHFVAFFTKRKQALHDLAAETIVVYGRNSEVFFADAWIDGMKSLWSRVPSFGSQRLTELERLQALREKNVLTEEEFEAEKKKILNY